MDIRYNPFSNSRKKYCDYSCWNSSEEKKKKFLEKHGVDNCSKLEIVKKKKIKTTMKNFGVKNPSQNESIKKKKIKTSMGNFGTEHPMKTDLIVDRINIP